MKRTLWNIVDVIWFLAFEILLALALGIPLIGLAFLPLALLFLRFFCVTVKKFSSSWIIWSIPYTFVSVFFLSFFAGQNSLMFTFKTFWLSLSQWFSAPISHFAMASIFFLVTYVVAYFVAHLLEGTLNTYIALAVSAIISGISTQYCCPLIAFGFGVLFVTSFILSLAEKRHFAKRTLFLFFILLIFGTLFFSLGTLHRPFTPLKSLFSFSHASNVTHSSTSVTNPSTFEHSTIAWRATAKAQKRLYVPSSALENLIFEVIIYIIGGAILAFGLLYFIAYFKFREKEEKEKNTKNFLMAMWILGSGAFILFMLMYIFSILGEHAKKGRLIHFNTPFLNSPQGLLSSGRFLNVFSTNGKEGSVFFNTFVWSVIAIFGLVTLIYMITKFLKSATPSMSKVKKVEEETLDGFNEDIKEPPAWATPSQKVLFCYHLLRKKIGNPSLTPYEFVQQARKKFHADDGIEKVTNLFVSLRYAHKELQSEEAEFVCRWVKEMLQKI